MGNADPYTGKKYSEMTSQERYDQFVKRGKDPHSMGRAFCHDCGYFPAYKPRVLVCNPHTHEVDKYCLDLPHLCDNCVQKRGLTRYGFLVPKPETKNVTESVDKFMATYPAWIQQMQDKQLKELIDSGMPEQDAKDMLGIAE